MNERDAKRAELLGKVEIEIACDCGTKVPINRSAKAFYCPKCKSSQLVGSNLGFVLADSDNISSKELKKP